jgi:tripartite-type tricarboxylate transporter receptor subunit TctC
MLVASRQSGIATVAQWLERTRARPGEVTYGSVGMGNSTHLAMEMVAQAAGVRLSHVPYSGSPPVTALLRGEVDCMLATIGTVIAHARSGALVPLAVLMDRRAPEMPEVPTLREAGIEAPTMPGWYALIGPAGVPMPAQERLNEAMRAALADATVRERLAALYLEPIPGTPQTIRATYERDSATWGDFIRRRGLRLD